MVIKKGDRVKFIQEDSWVTFNQVNRYDTYTVLDTISKPDMIGIKVPRTSETVWFYMNYTTLYGKRTSPIPWL